MEQGRRAEQMAGKNNASAVPLFTTKSKAITAIQIQIVRYARNLTVHVANAEGNRRRPLRPLRTQKEEPSSRLRKKWARVVKSSPNGTVVRSALHNGPTYVSRPIHHNIANATVCQAAQSPKTSSLTSSQTL